MKTVLISAEKAENHVVGVGPPEYAAGKDIGTAMTGVTALLEQMDITDTYLWHMHTLRGVTRLALLRPLRLEPLNK